jgi:hypothetical protein
MRPLAEGVQARLVEGPRLRMILEPGTASSGDLTELLAELSILNRRLGGPGVEFLVNECRTWKVPVQQAGGSANAASRAEAGKGTKADRSFVEVYAVPKASSEPDAQPNTAHWDRFTASLFMVLRLDAGQANYFDLAESVPREHPSFILATDAARRAVEKSARAPEAKNAAIGDASVDALNQHLQKIEELRRKLEREDSLVLELAPAVEIPAVETSAVPVTAAVQPQSQRRLVTIIVAVIAAAGVLIGGLFYVLRAGSTKHAERAPVESQSATANYREGALRRHNRRR